MINKLITLAIPLLQRRGFMVYTLQEAIALDEAVQAQHEAKLRRLIDKIAHLTHELNADDERINELEVWIAQLDDLTPCGSDDEQTQAMRVVLDTALGRREEVAA